MCVVFLLLVTSGNTCAGAYVHPHFLVFIFTIIIIIIIIYIFKYKFMFICIYESYVIGFQEI